MKKTIIALFLLVLIAAVLTSCGKKDGTGDTQTETKKAAESKADNKDETNDPEEQSESTELYDPADYAFVQKFEAPTGDYRQIVKDYMIKMSEITWTPSKDFTVDWKEKGDFSVGLKYKAGTTYKGVIYSQTKGDFYQFEQYIQDGKFVYDGSTYYEEIVGNHCSASMDMCFQQLINFPYKGSLKPRALREGLLQFPTDLQKPEDDSYISADLFSLNGREKIMEAYAALDTGDILYKSIKGSGHTRLVDKVELKKSATGQINYPNSVIYTIEQTNAFESKKNPDFVKKNGYDTTWWIDHTYTFKELFDSFFMPVTLTVYHSGEELMPAYIVLDKKITPENVANGFDSKILSNFPFSFARILITDQNGKTVNDKLINDLNPDYGNEYSIDLSAYSPLTTDLPAGNYHLTLSSGIARGRCEICSFDFTK